MRQFGRAFEGIFLAVVMGSAVLAIGCQAGLPAVVTSTGSHVAVEFAMDGNLEGPAKLAKEECAKHGKEANFTAVDSTATTSSRIANFDCIEGSGEAGAADASAETAETPAE